MIVVLQLHPEVHIGKVLNQNEKIKRYVDFPVRTQKTTTLQPLFSSKQ
jgi:hypothetical protein